MAAGDGNAQTTATTTKKEAAAGVGGVPGAERRGALDGGEAAVPLDVFGLSREEFRLMVMLHRDGRLQLSEAEEKLGRSRESVYETVQRAEEFGWVRRGTMHLPAAEVRQTRLPKERRNKPRVGRRVGTIALSAEGEKLIGTVLPKQEEMLRLLMAELDSREMKSLIRICGKLRREEDFTRVRFGAALIRASEEFDQGEPGGEREDED